MFKYTTELKDRSRRESFNETESKGNMQPKKKESHRKESTTVKKYEHRSNVHIGFKSPRDK